jgi:hypothetical protein
MLHLVENAKMSGLLKPAADAAGRTSRYISIKDMHRIFLIVVTSTRATPPPSPSRRSRRRPWPGPAQRTW